ncbi:MAG: leucine-rich repeat protein [Coriobacteriales bacterium]
MGIRKAHGHRRLLVAALVVACAAALAGGAYAWGMSYYSVDYSWYTSDAVASKSFEISSAGQLQALSNLVNGTYDTSEVKADGGVATDGSAIDFEGCNVNLVSRLTFTASDVVYGFSLTPIGTEEHPFNGTFDGAKYDSSGNITRVNTVSYLLLSTEDSGAACGTEYVGLFGHVGPEGTIKNLTVRDTCGVTVSSSETDSRIAYVGSIVGYCEGSVENCSSNADVAITWDDGDQGDDRSSDYSTVIDGIGGIAGYCDGDISSCSFGGSLSASTPANAYYYSTDAVSIPTVAKYIGGIVGRSGGDPTSAGLSTSTYGSISDCTNEANVTVITSGAGGEDRFGETVDSKSFCVGGIAGYAIGDISDCQNEGDILASSYVYDDSLSESDNQDGYNQADGGADSCGGIVGGYRSEGVSTATVNTDRNKYFKTEDGISADRGIVGRETTGTADTITLANCTNLGSVEACNNVGGIVGNAGTYTLITACANGDAKKGLADDTVGQVICTRWNKPRTGGIAGACYGTISYSRNHGEVTTSKSGYYLGGICGDLYYYRNASNEKFVTPEIYACYSTGQIGTTKALRRGALLGGNGGYIHDCLFLYGSAGSLSDDDEDADEDYAGAIGYSNASDEGTSSNLSVAYSSESQIESADDEDGFLMKSSTAVAWLNNCAPRESWAHYWMLASSVNRGYPVLSEEGQSATASMDLESLQADVQFLDDAKYSTAYNPTPKVQVTVTIDGVETTLVENADYYVQADPDALDENGVCKGTTSGRPYTASIVGIGNYSGVTGSVSYGIDKGDFSECTITATQALYTGEAQNDPTITVYDAAGGVVDPENYTVVVNGGEDCIKPGSYSVTARTTDSGYYTGHCTGTYTISQINIATDCDVIGVTYDDPDNGERVWFYDDESYKLYEVSPELDSEGNLETYTLEELEALNTSEGWGLTSSQLEGYVGYPKVEGFEIYHDGNDETRLLTSATPKETDSDGNPVYGMSLSYTAGEINPEVIGVNWSQGKLDSSWWQVIYGGGSAGGLEASGVENIEASTTGAITVAYSGAYTTNYDLITFDIVPVTLTADDLEISQTVTSVKYDGSAPDAPEVTVTYQGNTVDPQNYSVTLDYEVNASGETVTGDSVTYNAGDTLFYKVHFYDGGSIKCDDITGEVSLTIVGSQTALSSSSIQVTIDPDWNDTYSFTDGISDPPVTVYDTSKSKTLEEGKDYTVSYSNDDIPGDESDSSAPRIILTGLNEYTGTRVERYTIKRGVLDQDALESIDARESNVRYSQYIAGMDAGIDISNYGPYFVYLANGYSAEQLSEELTIVWKPKGYEHSSAQEELGPGNARTTPLFNVDKLFDSSGSEIDRAVEPGEYKAQISGRAEGGTYFEVDSSTTATITFYIVPVNLEEDVYTDTDGSEYNLTHYSWSHPTLSSTNSTTFYGGQTEYYYTGNSITPKFTIVDEYAYRNWSTFQADYDSGGDAYTSYVFDSEDYTVKTLGYEDTDGPVEPGSYQVSEITASDTTTHMVGTYDADGILWAEHNKYTIVAADLTQFQVADSSTTSDDLASGNWIVVDDAYYGDTGATPKVHFYVDGEECNYVEGTDYSLSYSNNTEVGTGTVRITVLDQDHLTATERDDEGQPYIDVNFEVKGEQVVLDDSSQTTWSLPESLALDDATEGTLVEPSSTATYTSESGSTVTVPSDAYTIQTGTYTDGTFTEKDSGWSAGDTVWYRVVPTGGTYERFSVSGDGVIGSSTVVGASESNSFDYANSSESTLTATLSSESVAYTGAEVTPDVTVMNDGTALTKGTDYKLVRSEGTDVGTYTVTVKGKGAYTGSCTLTFSITAADISSCSVEVSGATYSGSQIEPSADDITLTLDGNELPDTDWTISGYGDNVAAGTGTVTLAAGSSGNLSGSNEFSFTIEPLELTSDRFTVTAQSQEFTGSNIELDASDITVVDTTTDTTLVYGTDYTVGYASDHRSVGTASITVSGAGNYTGNITSSFSIQQTDLSDAEVSVSASSGMDDDGNFYYTGSAIKPDVTVTLNGVTLSLSDDYTVSYSNNTDVGEATVTVTGTGNCTGTASTTFAIVSTELSSANATLAQSSSSYEYTGAAITPSVTLKLRGKKISTDNYDLSYEDADGNALDGAPTELGTYKVIATGKNYLSGSVSTSFSIVKVDISNCTVTLGDAYYAFGDAVQPTVTVTTSAGVTVPESEYTVTYAGGTGEPGTSGTVSITGNNEHVEGAVTRTFVVSKIPITKEDIVFADSGTYTYTGSTIKPNFSIQIGERTLVEGTDYTLTYLGDATSVGGQSVEIDTPDSSVYTSEITVSYTIVKKSTSSSSASVSDGTNKLVVVGSNSYRLHSNKTATLVSAGSKVKSYSVSKIKYRGKTYKVTAIGKKAFAKRGKLVKVTGCKNLKSIGKSAFAGCKKLKKVSISSKSLKSIGKSAFSGCKKLKTLSVAKTTKLTKKGVKGSLKGSKIKTVKVKKAKLKAYKKIFKKKNCGRKVAVKRG